MTAVASGPTPRRVELRSDSFTLPTSEMLHAMVAVELGGEDPTVRQLEALAARMLGKQAGCFMPSDSMSSLAAILTHCAPGSTVIVGEHSEMYGHESGGAAACGDVTYQPVPNQPDGGLDLTAVEVALRSEPGQPDPGPARPGRPTLLCLEDPQAYWGGRVLPLSYLETVRGLTRDRGLALHLDGTRIFNASLSSQVPVEEIASYADSVQFCLSKGLGAPFGSMLVGSEAFVEQARRVRRMLGGGMHRAGVLAAAGIVALQNRGRLAHDHEVARHLAYGLAKLPGIAVEPAEVETNVVCFQLDIPHIDLGRFISGARARGVALAELAPGWIRAITHHGVDLEDIDYVLGVIRSILEQSTRPRLVPNRRSHVDCGPALAG